MNMIVLLAALVTVVQLADTYLRYLPFVNQITADLTRRLWQRLIIWVFIASLLYAMIFFNFGINAVTCKAVLMLGWAPYVLISAFTIKGKNLQHVFICGMDLLWSLLQHNWAAMICVLFIFDGTEETYFFAHLTVYLALFVVMLPIEWKYFKTLLPSEQFFDSRPQGYYIAFLPIVIGLGHFMLWADAALFHSWLERFSRLALLLMFFFIYKYVLTEAQTFFDHKRTLRENQLGREQLRSLENHNRTMSINQNQLDELRDNMQSDYQSILGLLEAGDVEGVRAHIKEQETLLDSTKMIYFCRQPLINAALSIYIQQAERHNIKCRHKINLPPTYSIDENDFAILLSNLLENAINASKKQPVERRELSITVQHRGKQCVLEIVNRCDKPLNFDKDGLPTTSREGHGIGMSSVKSFMAKYNVQALFDQSDGRVRFSMYWKVDC